MPGRRRRTAWSIRHDTRGVVGFPKNETAGPDWVRRYEHVVLSRTRVQTMSFNALSAVIFTTLRAGLALNIICSPVNGFTPLRA